MGQSNWATAMLLLGGLVVLTVAGVSALQASQQQTDTALADANEQQPAVLSMGEDVQTAIVTALPWLGLIAVPLGIAGILGAVALSFPTRSNRMSR